LSVSDLCAFLHCAQERAFFVVMSSWEDPVGIIVSARSSLEGSELKNTKTNIDWWLTLTKNITVWWCPCMWVSLYVSLPHQPYLLSAGSV
jgi:hypothetical protein